MEYISEELKQDVDQILKDGVPSLETLTKDADTSIRNLLILASVECSPTALKLLLEAIEKIQDFEVVSQAKASSGLFAPFRTFNPWSL